MSEALAFLSYVVVGFFSLVLVVLACAGFWLLWRIYKDMRGLP